jgi:dUTP pyrophosphatase
VDTKVYFAKVRPDAIIPSKKVENAGYDIYANFAEDYMIIAPHETKMIPTGIASACSPDYYFQLFERGSTGTKGIGQRCGVIDSGYRNEWFVPITNHNDKPLVIRKKGISNYQIFGDVMPYTIDYPYDKAISQAVLFPVPKVDIEEVTYEELLKIESERGLGCLGSSNK